MASAKEIRVVPIAGASANAAVCRWHYSGKVAKNSQLHLGVFLKGRLLGAMQFGPSLDKKRTIGLVRGTPWSGFLELNRMAFSDALPRNSESRAIAIAMRLIRRKAPHVQWVVSFADGAQCGDGTIYRASGFVLTSIKANKTILRFPDGTITTDVSLRTSAKLRSQLGMTAADAASIGGIARFGGKPLRGYQLRYVYFLDPSARERLTVPILPFSEIERQGASMYRGKPCAGRNGPEPIHP